MVNTLLLDQGQRIPFIMKIAFIGQKGIPARSGGVERHVQALATRLANEGHEVSVYTRAHYAPRDLTSYKKVRIVYVPSIPTKHLDAITHTFFATLHALFTPYDVIHYQSIGPTSLAWIIKLFKRKTALIATFHCKDYEHKKWGLFARWYLKIGEYVACHIPDKTIVVSRSLKEYVEDVYRNDAVYIPNGYEGAYEPLLSRLARWHIRKKAYILVVTRLVQHKGVHDVIEAFHRLEAKGILPPEYKLVVVGKGAYTDAYVASLRQLAKANPRILFLGEQNGKTLKQLYSHAGLFVHPSLSEGLSIALLEAMGYGCPVLASDIPQNKEALGDSGFFFRAGDADSLTRELEMMLGGTYDLAAAGAAAKKRVKKYFQWSAVAKKTAALYEEVLHQKHLPVFAPAKRAVQGKL